MTKRQAKALPEVWRAWQVVIGKLIQVDDDDNDDDDDERRVPVIFWRVSGRFSTRITLLKFARGTRDTVEIAFQLETQQVPCESPRVF